MAEKIAIGDNWYIETVGSKSYIKQIKTDTGVSVSGAEASIIRKLARSYGSTVNYKNLIIAVWGAPDSRLSIEEIEERKKYLSQRVSRLNKKLLYDNISLKICNTQKKGYYIVDIEDNTPLDTSVSFQADWKDNLLSHGHLLMDSRGALDKRITLDERFGLANKVKNIRLCAYTANLIFDPGSTASDSRAFSHTQKVLSKTFQSILSDREFEGLEVILQAPYSKGSADALAYGKIANSKLINRPAEFAFLNSYFNLKQLVKSGVYGVANWEGTFSLYLCTMPLPYSIMEVVYKDGFEQYDHIKVDLYSIGLESSVERRSFYLFRDYDQENYNFFKDQYTKIRQSIMSKDELRECEKEWEKEWEAIKAPV